MNNDRVKNDIPSLNTLNAKKENNLHLGSTCDSNIKSVKESAFRNEKSVSLEVKSEQFENNTLTKINSHNDKGISSVKAAMAIKKKRFLKSTKTFKESKKLDHTYKVELLNDNSVESSEALSFGIDDVNKILSCQFCRKEFETSEHFSVHECSKEKFNSNLTVHKCKFCALTFPQKHSLDRHVKGHKRNNCTICNAQFTKRKALCKHLKFEHNIVEPEKLHHCSFCSKHFYNRSSLNTHLKSHANGQHFCLKCGFMCDNEDIFNDHVKEHIKNSKYECHLCGKKFVRRQQHDQHMMGHERHLCSSCNISFSTKKLFLKHQQSIHGAHISEKKHACPICKKLFLRPKHLQIHQRIHTGEKPVKCSHCEKNFRGERYLSKHMKTVRHLQRVNIDEGKVIEIEKPFLCSECGARFYRQQSLFRHVELIHSSSESFKCPHCNYDTKCKTNLKRHIELHTDTKRFICEICGSSFRAFATLKEHHAFVHSENRGFICSICSKGFKNRSTLQRHLRIHSEVRPYKCYCNRDYKRMSHLKRHMVSAHHMTFKKNQIPIITESTNLATTINNENVASALESLEALPDDSSCDGFSLLTVSNNNTVCNDLTNSGLNENTSEEQLSASTKGDNYTDVPSNTMQTLLDKRDAHIDPKSTLITLVSDSHIKTPPLCLAQDPHTSNSVSLDDPNLNLSPNNFCNFNLPSSPLSSIPLDSVTSSLVNSIASPDVFSSSTDSLIRPHSLPNLNFQTPASSMDSFTHFTLNTSDSPTSLQISPFLLNGDIPSPSHVNELNLEQNNSTKQLFGDSDDILSLPPYTSSNQLSGVNCTSDNLFNSARDIELWDTGDNSNRFKILDSDLVTTSTCANSSFPTSSVNNLLAHSLMSSNDSLIVYPLDSIILNSEFDALSNLC